MGFPTALAIYECGPDYLLAAPEKQDGSSKESIGKSLAAGVSTLDAFLYSAQKGCGPAAYFAFGTVCAGPRIPCGERAIVPTRHG